MVYQIPLRDMATPKVLVPKSSPKALIFLEYF